MKRKLLLVTAVISSVIFIFSGYQIYLNSLEEVHALGLTPCGVCKPPS